MRDVVFVQLEQGEKSDWLNTVIRGSRRVALYSFFLHPQKSSNLKHSYLLEGNGSVS